MTRTLCSLLILVVFAFWLSTNGIGRVTAAETDCPSGEEWVPCRAQQGDPMAMYAMGRRAYDDARTSGDFTAALGWSRKLAAAGDENGTRLLKMVYLQLGWGAHRDYVQAYVWLSEAIAAGDGYLTSWRNKLVEKMSAEQIAEAKKRTGG